MICSTSSTQLALEQPLLPAMKQKSETNNQVLICTQTQSFYTSCNICIKGRSCLWATTTFKMVETVSLKNAFPFKIAKKKMKKKYEISLPTPHSPIKVVA